MCNSYLSVRVAGMCIVLQEHYWTKRTSLVVFKVAWVLPVNCVAVITQKLHISMLDSVDLLSSQLKDSVQILV